MFHFVVFDPDRDHDPDHEFDPDPDHRGHDHHDPDPEHEFDPDHDRDPAHAPDHDQYLCLRPKNLRFTVTPGITVLKRQPLLRRSSCSQLIENDLLH